MRRSTTWWLMALHVGLAAVTYVFSKWAAVGFPDPESLTLARAGGSALILVLLTGWAIPRPRFSLRDWWGILVCGFLLVPANQYLFLRGMRHTAPGHAPLLYVLTPMFVLLLTSAYQKRMPGILRIIGVLLSLLGAMMLLRPWDEGQVARELRTGDFWLLGAVVAWGVYSVYAKRLCREQDPMAVTSWSLIVGAALIVPFCGPQLFAVQWRELSTAAWVGLIWMIAITSVVMMLVWNVLLKHLEPVQVAICMNAQPPATALFTAILAWFSLAPEMTDLGLWFWIGMVVILAGVALVQRQPAHSRASGPLDSRLPAK